MKREEINIYLEEFNKLEKKKLPRDVCHVLALINTEQAGKVLLRRPRVQEIIKEYKKFAKRGRGE